MTSSSDFFDDGELFGEELIDIYNAAVGEANNNQEENHETNGT